MAKKKSAKGETSKKAKASVPAAAAAAKDLQNAINGGGSAGGKFKSGRSQAAGTKNHRCPGAEADGSGTAVGELRLNWRGQDGANVSEPEAAPVPSLENDQYFPPFSITWPHGWACIANGEWAIRDHLACPLGDPQIPVGYPRGRQFEYRRLRGRLDLNCRPVGAVSA